MESEVPFKRLKRSWLRRSFSRLETGGVRSSILTLTCTILGPGLLSIPFAFSELGVVLGVVMSILTPVCFHVFYLIVVDLADKYETYDYNSLMFELYGSFGRRMGELVVIINCLGTIVGYIVLTAEFIESVMMSFELIGETEVEEIHIWVIVGMTLFVYLPLSLFKKLTALGYISIASVIAIMYVTILVIAETPDYLEEQGDEIEEISLFRVEWDSIRAVGVIFFSFDGFENISTIYSELQFRSKKRMQKIIERTHIFLSVLVIVLGITGYISTVNHVPDSILFRTPVGGGSYLTDWPMVVARIMMCILMTICIPLQVSPSRSSIKHFVIGRRSISSIEHGFLTVCILSGTAVISIFVPSILIVYNLLGGFVITVMSFFLPMMMYWKTEQGVVWKIGISALALGLTGLGICCAVYEIYILY